MGQEFAQAAELDQATGLDRHLLDNPEDAGVQRLVRDLHALYRAQPSMHALVTSPDGFQWIEADDAARSVLAWIRRSAGAGPDIVATCNFTPVERSAYTVCWPLAGRSHEALNTDAEIYGGRGRGNMGGVTAVDRPSHGQPASTGIYLPPLSVVFLVREQSGSAPSEPVASGRRRPLVETPSSLARDSMAFVLAGGRGSRLKELTDRRAKPAVHFGGKSRIIDFALSNALNSGIRKMSVATQYKAHSLIRHCQRGWNFFRAERNEYLDILPASQRVDEHQWYLGTADAVTQNIDIVDSYDVKYVLILAGDHIYKMDYGKMIAQHAESGADVTVGCLTVPRMEATAFGVMAVDANDTITSFLEKPADPPGTPDDPSIALASMGIYVFNWNLLRDLLIRDADDSNSSHDFGKDIIPQIVSKGIAKAHRFEDSCVRHTPDAPAYWRDVGTVDAFWKANIDLTDFDPDLDLWDKNWPIWTYSEVAPPAKFIHDEEKRRGTAVSSLVSGGCIISGTEIRQSLLFTQVHTNSYASLEQAVVLPYARIARHARLKKVVIDSGVEIPEGLVVGEDPVEDAKWFRVSDNGVTLITQAMLDMRESKLR